MNASDAEAHYGLAMVYAQTEDTAQAQEQFQAALRFRPVYPEALNNLGILYLRPSGVMKRWKNLKSVSGSRRVLSNLI